MLLYSVSPMLDLAGTGRRELALARVNSKQSVARVALLNIFKHS